jgi:hypothetical protein
MALVLAIICWMYIYNVRIEPPQEIDVPLVIETPPQIISRAEKDGEVINFIRVSLESPREASAERSRLVCRYKIKELNEPLDKPQIRMIELASSDFNLKPGMTIKEFIPDNKIQVVLMREITKPMKIKTDGIIQGVPQKGYRVSSVRATPTEIFVRGPKNVLDKYNEVPIAKIDVTNRNSFFSWSGRIESLENVKIFTEDYFSVDVVIDEDIIEGVRTVKINILVPADFPPFPINVKPQEKVLKFKGPGSKIKALKAGHINLFVNLGELCPNPSEVKPPMTFAPKLEWRLTPDAPSGIELAEPLDQIKLEILLPSATVSAETIPEKPPEPPPQSPKNK